MSTPRYRPAAVVAGNGQIYVFGGQNDSGFLNSAEVYTPSTNSWAQLPPMPTARYGMGAALGADGHIYVVGGQNGPTGPNETLATVEVYG